MKNYNTGFRREVIDGKGQTVIPDELLYQVLTATAGAIHGARISGGMTTVETGAIDVIIEDGHGEYLPEPTGARKWAIPIEGSSRETGTYTPDTILINHNRKVIIVGDVKPSNKDHSTPPEGHALKFEQGLKGAEKLFSDSYPGYTYEMAFFIYGDKDVNKFKKEPYYKLFKDRGFKLIKIDPKRLDTEEIIRQKFFSQMEQFLTNGVKKGRINTTTLQDMLEAWSDIDTLLDTARTLQT